MPELSTAPLDSALDGTENLLTLAFAHIPLQLVADFPESKGANIASAATTNIGASSGPFAHITGTATITAFDLSPAGTERVIVFDGILILTHNSSSVILPTGESVTTAPGDIAIFRSEGSGNWRCVGYQRASGAPLAPGPISSNDIATIRSVPQVINSANYTAVLSDAGKHLLHPSADTTARVFTIPGNSVVAYPVGTALTFVNQNGAGVLTIAITSDTMILAGAGTTGSRTLAGNGICTALKITSTQWIISGTGLT